MASTTMAMACLATAAASTPAQDWQPVPIRTAEQRAAGIAPGGEGGQWFRDIQVSRSDPSFLVLAIDVGGIYRTRDGGARWEPANVGYKARGCNAVAIDPRNPQRVLAVAGNSLDWKSEWGASPHGVYLSTDQAASWSQVLERHEGTGSASQGDGGSIEFDPSSFDEAQGFCTVAYFAPRDGGLFRSADGGATWTQVHEGFGKAWLKVADDGAVFVAGACDGTRGLFASRDGGNTFEHVVKEGVHGLDVEHGRVYVSGGFGVRVSQDGGTTFRDIAGMTGLDRQNNKPVLNVTVSPARPDTIAAWIQGDNWNWTRFVSHDGGRSWKASRWDNDLSTLPYNRRQGHWAFHPTDPRLVYSIGGDWATRSTDGGATFAWHSNGYNGVMLGRSFNFSPTAPQNLALFFQDYNGAVTRDGGETWAYYDVSGKGWGGYNYGGHTPDGVVIFGGDAPDWGGKRRLRISLDAGKTWSVAKDESGGEIVFGGFDIGYSDPTDADVLFASEWRSTDRGRTWRKMQACDGVFTSNPSGERELFGRSGDAVVRSVDQGETWQKLADVPGGKINDIAFDHVGHRLYVVSENRLKTLDLMRESAQWRTVDTPKDQRGASRLESVAVDPQDPSVVYACGPANIYLSHATISRSIDAGQTWENLTNTRPLTELGQDGPHECQWVRVHPVTREAWVNGQCFGMWKIAPPDGDGR